MSRVAGPPPGLTLEVATAAPPDWDDKLAGIPAAGYAASAWWTAAVARHHDQTSPLWVIASFEGRVVGTLPAISRRRRGLDRLESHLDGTPGGPTVDPALPPDLQAAVCDALIATYAAQVKGRTIAAALTLSAQQDAAVGPRLARTCWRGEVVSAALLDLTGGLDHVERNVLSNNRRNERNRGLKRGCTLHVTSDPADVAAWYPVYVELAAGWAQTPARLSFLEELIRTRAEQVFLVHVRHEGAIIGGHLCIHWRDRVTALYGASRRDVAKVLFPSTLLYWQDIVVSCARGAATLDFGGHAGLRGLQRYKQLMGTCDETRGQYVCWQPAWRPLIAARRLLGRRR